MTKQLLFYLPPSVSHCCSLVHMAQNDTQKAFYNCVYKPYQGEQPRKRKRVSISQADTLEEVFQRTQHPTAVERYKINNKDKKRN